jgi:DNA primase
MNNPSEEIKSKLDVVEVLREYIQLKPAGVNFRANCPFHREKTPSFIISPEKQIWHCFGCGKGGDIFTFVMEMEGLSFVEALRLLAGKAGVELKKTDPAQSSKRNRLLDLLKLSVRYYHKVLLDSPAGAPARAYLERRGFTAETIENWQIGYSPDTWDSLLNFLKSKNYSEDEIFQSGLSVKKENAPGYYDRFRGRIMFPINDPSGNPVAFTARVSPEREATEKMGKYINSPQTIVYDKSRILFGLDKAKMKIKDQASAVLVEGQADVITAHQNGFANVIAASGTALTTEQVNLIKRYTPNIFLAFDMDKAGEMAIERGTKEAMRAEMNIKVIELPSGKDPDEFIKNNPGGWPEAISAAKPVMQYFFDKIFSKLDLRDIGNKRQGAKEFLPLVANLGNRIEQESWLKRLGEAIDISESVLKETLAADKKTRASDIGPADGKKAMTVATPANYTREELLSHTLLSLLIRFPEHIEYAMNNLETDQLTGEANQTLYRNLVIYYTKTIDNWTQSDNSDYAEAKSNQADASPIVIDYKEFRAWLAEIDDQAAASTSLESDNQEEQNINTSQPALLDRLSLLAEKDFYDFTREQAKKEIVELIISLKKNFLSTRLKEIEKNIGQAEVGGEKEKAKAMMEEFKLLSDELKTLAG